MMSGTTRRRRYQFTGSTPSAIMVPNCAGVKGGECSHNQVRAAQQASAGRSTLGRANFSEPRHGSRFTCWQRSGMAQMNARMYVARWLSIGSDCTTSGSTCKRDKGDKGKQGDQ